MDQNSTNPINADLLLRELDQLQMAVADLTREVDEQAALASVGVLAASIAHEVCNRMTPVAGCAQMALKHPDDQALTQRALEMAASSAIGIAEFARVVLGLARSGAIQELAEADVRLAWARVHELVKQASTGARIRFESRLEDCMTVRMPQAALDHVLLNLAMNAIRSMTRGGVLRVVGRTEGCWVELRIEDNGCGMDTATLERATEPGFTMRGGTGLGLSLCDRLVRAAGGRLSIKSEADAGTTVAVVLPVA